MLDDRYGLFIGFAALPPYANKENNIVRFKEEVIDQTFRNYKTEVQDIIQPDKKLNTDLYLPIHFYAFGHFNLISISFIDDFHFGTYSFRPFNRYLKDKNTQNNDPENSNFEYQIYNCFNLKTKKEGKITLENMASQPFVGISKIKINSALLIGNGIALIEKIKYIIQNYSWHDEVDFIVSESLSWNEITIVLFSKSLSSIMKSINQLRFETTTSLGLTDFIPFSLYGQSPHELGDIHLFTDTETTYGCNSLFFDSKDKRINLNSYDFSKDNELSISSRVQIKTGHGAKFHQLLDYQNFNQYLNEGIHMVNGKSDYSFSYKNTSNTNALKNYLLFWTDLLQNDKGTPLLEHMRKTHSNISLKFTDSLINNANGNTLGSLETKFHSELFNKLKFDYDTIGRVEGYLKKLRISKNISNTIISLYINFNEVVCDINLFAYYLDLKPLLLYIYNFLETLADPKAAEDAGIMSTRESWSYRPIEEIQIALQKFTEIFKNAYNNRFQDSKKHGDNSDVKLEFNGGVHQIIQTYDAIFKIAYKTFSLSSEKSSQELLPVASFGSFETGIKSSIINLHLDYFQLFQPEFFAFSLIKETSNFILSRPSPIKDESGQFRITISNIVSLRSLLSNMIHDETDIYYKKLLFEFIPPQDIVAKVNYICQYVFFINTFGEEDKKSFTYWFWFCYMQNSSVYNSDGSLALNSFKETFFAFYFAYRFTNGNIEPSLSELLGTVGCEELNFYLSDSQTNVFRRCGELYDYIFLEGKDNKTARYEWEKTRFEVRDKIIRIVQDVKKMSEKMDFIAQKNSWFSEIIQICKTFLGDMETLYFDKNTNSHKIYQRKYDSAIGIFEKNYSKAVFDPLGGIFLLDKNLRLETMKKRLKFLNDLRNISLIHLKEKMDF